MDSVSIVITHIIKNNLNKGYGTKKWKWLQTCNWTKPVNIIYYTDNIIIKTK